MCPWPQGCIMQALLATTWWNNQQLPQGYIMPVVLATTRVEQPAASLGMYRSCHIWECVSFSTPGTLPTTNRCHTREPNTTKQSSTAAQVYKKIRRRRKLRKFGEGSSHEREDPSLALGLHVTNILTTKLV